MNFNRTAFFFFLLLLLFPGSQTFCQTPTTCFEIQSIMVDACGNPEGENEMVRFIIGPTDMNTNNLNVNWPNNSYLGICQDATTASHVATLNASIQACGLILEPIAGNLPAGATVLLVTSTAMNPLFNSFASLTDTIYMIFQCAGNTSGHFRNFSLTTAVRTLEMNFGGICDDIVNYDASNLVDQNGNRNVADGSTVEYTFSGAEIYTNPGCQAPISTVQVNLTSTPNVCSGDLINLNAVIISGNYSSIFWSGGAGTILNPLQLSTGYQTSFAFQGTDIIQLGIVGTCTDTIYKQLQINIGSGTSPNIVLSGPNTICVGDSVTLTASAGNSYLWSTNETTASITVSTANTYSVTVIGTCGTGLASQTISVDPLPQAQITASGPTMLCAGASTSLTASGNGTYFWSTGETTASISVNTENTYILTVTNNCGTDTASRFIQTEVLPAALITGAPGIICPGETVTLSASGGTTYQWSTGEITSSIEVISGGNYSVIVSNACGTDSSNVAIVQSVLDVRMTADTLIGAAPLHVSFTNNSINGINYTWDFGDGSSSTTNDPIYTYESDGTFTVRLTGEDAQGCTDNATLTIQVFDDTQIYIPNSFTPNGDGINEIFNIYSNKKNLQFTGYIFNRWGAEIATWNSIQTGWDGISPGGIEAQEGIYIYLINIIFQNGEVEERHGKVALIR